MIGSGNRRCYVRFFGDMEGVSAPAAKVREITPKPTAEVHASVSNGASLMLKGVKNSPLHTIVPSSLELKLPFSGKSRRAPYGKSS